jgi:hypothetical protein
MFYPQKWSPRKKFLTIGDFWGVMFPEKTIKYRFEKKQKKKRNVVLQAGDFFLPAKKPT